MPMKKSEGSAFLPKLGLEGWKDGETKTLKFLDDGVDFTGQYGLTYIYGILYDGSEMSIWIRPGSPLQIGLQPIVNEYEHLKGLTVKIRKVLGAKQKDTRYECELAPSKK